MDMEIQVQKFMLFLETMDPQDIIGIPDMDEKDGRVEITLSFDRRDISYREMCKKLDMLKQPDNG